MTYLQIWFLLWHSLFGQSIPFPGPGRAPAGGIINLDKDAAQCPAECASNQRTITLDAAAGSFIIVSVFSCANSCVDTPLDADLTSLGDGSNTYVDDGFSNHENYGIWQYHIQVATGGTHTITAQFAADKAWYSAIWWSNYSGSGSTLDEIASAHAGSGTTPSVTTSGNLDVSNELLYGIAVGHSTIAAAAPYTALSTSINGARNEWMQGGTSGMTATATWTQTSAAWHALIATYKP